MTELTPNQQAIRNGNWGERRAQTILTDKFGNVDYVNDLVDFYVDNGVPVEVKTCQQFINRVDDKPVAIRLGRFTFDREQHEYLLTNEGYYLFLVRNGDLLVHVDFLRADDVFAWMSNFQRQLCWRFLIKER